MFAERGFDGATLDDIAAAAGLSKGAIYSSFASKDELVLILMEERVQQRTRAAAEAFNRAQDTTTGARAIGSELTQAITSDAVWQRLFLEYWFYAIRDPQHRGHLLERRRELRRMIADTIRQAAEDHDLVLALPPDQLAVTLLAISNGFAVERLLDPESVPADLFGQIVAQLVDK